MLFMLDKGLQGYENINVKLTECYLRPFHAINTLEVTQYINK